MMIVARELFGVFLSWALGIAIIRLFTRGKSPLPKLFLIFLGWGIGAGASSVIWFWLYVIPRFKSIYPIIGELVVLIVALSLGHRPCLQPNRQKLLITRTPKSSAITPQLIAKLLGALVVAVLFIAAAYFWMFSWYAPQGEWDAWAIWNLHARILFKGIRTWRTELAALPYSHPDYPLLEPLTVVRFWSFGNQMSPIAQELVAFLFTFCTAGVFFGILDVLKSRWQSAIGVVTLFGMVSYVHLGAAQYADIPFSLYLLSCFALFTYHHLSQDNTLLLPLVGLSAGFAVWTKNEGWLFLVALLIADYILVSGSQLTSPFFRRVQHFAAGFAFPALTTLIEKGLIRSRSDVLTWAVKPSNWVRAFDWQRISVIMHGFGQKLWTLDNWIVSPVVVIVVFGLLLGKESRPDLRKCGRIGLFMIFIILLGYAGIYTISDQDVKWYIATSLQRLYLQLWPLFLFSLLLFLRIPFFERYSFDLLKNTAVTPESSTEQWVCHTVSPNVKLLSVVVPAYNEQPTLTRVVNKLLDVPYLLEIIIVDDCSTDQTNQFAQYLAEQHANIRVIRHSKNMGKTAALNTGFAATRGKVVIVQDADLEYDPAEIVDVIQPIIEGVADVVYGSRFLVRKAARVLYFYHYLANKGLTFLSNVLTNINLSDVETGYKAFRGEIIRNMIITSRGFGCEIEVTAKIAKLKCPIYEVPISYYGRTYDEGKKIGISDGIVALWYLVRYNLMTSLEESYTTVPARRRTDLPDSDASVSSSLARPS